MVNAFTPLNQLEPVQAANIEGVGYLEEVISGYRTLKVEGREPLNLDLENIEIITRDGARYKRRRIESRQLTIHFALTAGSSAEFETKFNSLKSCLYKVEEAKIIFDDEPDKYYVGTYKGAKIDFLGRSAYRGEISIECADPFKYSVEETEVTAQTVDGQKVIACNYGGTYKSYPRIEATCSSDNGFYGFASSGGAALQVGDPEEVDAEDVQKSETLINDSFAEGLPSGWTANAGVTSTPEVDIMSGSWETYESANKGDGIGPASYGSGSYWHGPGACKAIPADSQGNTGATNFKAAWQWETFTYLKDELTNVQFNVIGEENGVKYVLAGIELMDGSPSSNACTWRLWINGEIIQSGSTTTRHDNPWSGISCSEPSIQKSGKEIIFRVAGQTYSFKNDAYEDLEATEITIYVAAHGTAAESDHAGFFYVHFRKDAVDVTEDIPNALMPCDIVELDTEAGTITVNGTEAPDLGAIGNEWEDFVLVPGLNTIVCAASTWVNDDTYTMRYREVYL